MVLDSTRFFASQARTALARTGIVESKELDIIKKMVLSRTASSKRTLYVVHPVQSCLLSEVRMLSL